MKTILGALFAVCALCTPSFADEQTSSEFAPFYYFGNPREAIVLAGPIDFRAPLAFRRALKAHPEIKNVVLHSEGGSVQAALLIAEEIFERGINTIVANKSVCESACSFIFFAGRDRAAFGRLGVHQISGTTDLKDAQMNLSDIIETLSKYDVSPAVITKMLRTPAEEMYYFSPQEIDELGINRLASSAGEKNIDRKSTATWPFFSKSDGAAETTHTPIPEKKPNYAENSIWAKSQDFVVEYLNSTIGSPSELAAIASTHYASTVVVNGVVTPRPSLVARLIRNAKTWPEREINVDTSSLITSCQREMCTVTGRYFYSQGDGKAPSVKSTIVFSFVVDAKRREIKAHNESN